VFFPVSDHGGGGFSMFAPPICRRRWRNNAFPFHQIRRRRRQPRRTSPRAERAIKQGRDARAAHEESAASARSASGYPATPKPAMMPAAPGDTYE
jgi:hypothetical protein